MLAIIGGSGLYSLEALNNAQWIELSTAWGKPSDAIAKGQAFGQDVLFLPRHGREHSTPPHKVNYRANIAALKLAGATQVIAVNAVGGIHPHMQAGGTLVIPNQIIDYSWGREHTFFDGDADAGKKLAGSATVGSGFNGKDNAVEYIEFGEPLDSGVRAKLLEAAKQAEQPVQNSGCYGCTQGPRLETNAEIRRLERDGVDVVGMTGMPEASLAKEAGLAYAMLSLVVNPAAGKSEQAITMEEIHRVMDQGMQKVHSVLSAYIQML